MDNEIGVYRIRNIKNNKFYVGSSVNLKRRKKSHFTSLKNENHFNNHLQRSFNKYGRDNFTFSIIVKCRENRLLDYEQYWINRLEVCKNTKGYNKAQKVQNRGGLKGKDNPNWQGGKCTVECEFCGSNYKVRQSKKEKSTFCSEKCKKKWQRENLGGKDHHSSKEKIVLKCENCGDKYKVCPCNSSGSKFCSKSCASSYKVSGRKNPFWNGGKTTVECNFCGNKYKVFPYNKDNSSYCSNECYENYKKTQKGENTSNSKLEKSEVIEIKKQLKKGNKIQQEIADEFNISRGNVSAIKTGELWSHVEIN